MKLKVLSSAISLVVMFSAQTVSAESIVAGQLVANPTATISADGIKQNVGSQVTSYIEGDSISTNAQSSAKVSLSSGSAEVVVAPNSKMSVKDASENLFLLESGAISVEAKSGQIVSIETTSGTFVLSSDSSVNAVVRIDNGSFAAISQSGSLNVESQDGVVTVVDSGNAYVFNDDVATSVDVQAAGGDVHEHQKDSGEIYSHGHDDGLLDHSHGAGFFTLNNALIVGGLVAATAVLSSTFDSDGSSSDDDEPASPAE